MTKRRGGIANLAVALVCAYLLALQTALGGFAEARAAAMIDSPFGVICINGQDRVDPDGGGGSAHHQCCDFACAPVAFAPPSAPEARRFAYDPRPAPLLAAFDRERTSRDEVVRALRRPRGPPSES